MKAYSEGPYGQQANTQHHLPGPFQIVDFCKDETSFVRKWAQGVWSVGGGGMRGDAMEIDADSCLVGSSVV